MTSATKIPWKQKISSMNFWELSILCFLCTNLKKFRFWLVGHSPKTRRKEVKGREKQHLGSKIHQKYLSVGVTNPMIILLPVFNQVLSHCQSPPPVVNAVFFNETQKRDREGLDQKHEELHAYEGWNLKFSAPPAFNNYLHSSSYTPSYLRSYNPPPPTPAAT